MGPNPSGVVLVSRYARYPQNMSSEAVNHFERFPRQHMPK